MSQYRKTVAQAAEFAAGNRDPLKRRLEQQMSAASRDLHFERAAALKQRIERLSEFDRPEYRFVAPLDDFRYIAVQRGGASSRAKVFLVCGGEVISREPLEYPLKTAQIEAAAGAMAALGERRMVFDRPRLYRMGLVVRYLFSGENRRGLIVRWDGSFSGERLSERIEGAADLLGLKVPRRAKRASGGRKQSERSSP